MIDLNINTIAEILEEFTRIDTEYHELGNMTKKDYLKAIAYLNYLQRVIEIEDDKSI